MPINPPIYGRDGDYFEIRDGRAGVIHRRHYELAKRKYDWSSEEDRRFLKTLVSGGNGFLVLPSEETNGIDLIFEEKGRESGIWGITDGLYELIFGENVDPEKDLNQIYRKATEAIGINLAPILTNEERIKFKMIIQKVRFD